jgi:hypothetical protein
VPQNARGIQFTLSVSNSGWLDNVAKTYQPFGCIKKKVVVENCRPHACRGGTRQPGERCQGAMGGNTQPIAKNNEQLPGYASLLLSLENQY